MKDCKLYLASSTDFSIILNNNNDTSLIQEWLENKSSTNDWLIIEQKTSHHILTRCLNDHCIQTINLGTNKISDYGISQNIKNEYLNHTCPINDDHRQLITIIENINNSKEKNIDSLIKLMHQLLWIPHTIYNVIGKQLKIVKDEELKFIIIMLISLRNNIPATVIDSIIDNCLLSNHFKVKGESIGESIKLLIYQKQINKSHINNLRNNMEYFKSDIKAKIYKLIAYHSNLELHEIDELLTIFRNDYKQATFVLDCLLKIESVPENIIETLINYVVNKMGKDYDLYLSTASSIIDTSGEDKKHTVLEKIFLLIIRQPHISKKLQNIITSHLFSNSMENHPRINKNIIIKLFDKNTSSIQLSISIFFFGLAIYYNLLKKEEYDTLYSLISTENIKITHYILPLLFLRKKTQRDVIEYVLFKLKSEDNEQLFNILLKFIIKSPYNNINKYCMDQLYDYFYKYIDSNGKFNIESMCLLSVLYTKMDKHKESIKDLLSYNDIFRQDSKASSYLLLSIIISKTISDKYMKIMDVSNLLFNQDKKIRSLSSSIYSYYCLKNINTTHDYLQKYHSSRIGDFILIIITSLHYELFINSLICQTDTEVVFLLPNKDHNHCIYIKTKHTMLKYDIIRSGNLYDTLERCNKDTIYKNYEQIYFEIGFYLGYIKKIDFYKKSVIFEFVRSLDAIAPGFHDKISSLNYLEYSIKTLPSGNVNDYHYYIKYLFTTIELIYHFDKSSIEIYLTNMVNTIHFLEKFYEKIELINHLHNDYLRCCLIFMIITLQIDNNVTKKKVYLKNSHYFLKKIDNSLSTEVDTTFLDKIYQYFIKLSDDTEFTLSLNYLSQQLTHNADSLAQWLSKFTESNKNTYHDNQLIEPLLNQISISDSRTYPNNNNNMTFKLL